MISELEPYIKQNEALIKKLIELEAHIKKLISVEQLAWKEVSPIKQYEEHHFSDNLLDIGVAFNNDRIWVCLNGIALLRAKVMNGKFFISYSPPEGA